MKRLVALFMVMTVVLFSGCTAKEDSSENKKSGSKKDKNVTDIFNEESYDSESDFYLEEELTEEEKTDNRKETATEAATKAPQQKPAYDSDSQYWLPVSYKSYYEDGSLKYEGEWKHNEEGFVTYFKYRNWTGNFVIEEKGDEVWVALPYVEIVENGETFYDENNTKFIYKFDDNGNLINRGKYYADDGTIRMFYEDSENNVSEELAEVVVEWLDEDGNIRYEYDTNQEINYYDNSTVNYFYEDESDWSDYTNKDSVDYARMMVASVWKTANTNPDGTKTTMVYYENGRIGEVIVWRPVSKRAFYQYYFFDKDWPYLGTLELLFRGS